MSFSPDYGCEVYEGDAGVIGAAIAASNWTALRDGTAARTFVGFPLFVWGGEFDLLGGAVASVLQQPEVPLRDERTIVGEDGQWSADVLPVNWVAAVAAVPARHIAWLARQWCDARDRLYEDTNAWNETELFEPLYRLTLLCRESLTRRSDVILLTI